MSRNVKRAGPRQYDSSRRQARAQESRAAVLRAALDRFLEQGYSSTTIAQVAGDADVSVETVYKTFGNKAGLLKAVFDVAVAGDDEPVPMVERDDIQRVIAEPDAARKLALYFDHFVDTMPRTAPVQLLVRDAAATNDDARAVWQQLRSEQLEAMTQFARDLDATGQLRVPATTARDLLWTYHSLELYELLVLERGWSRKRYRAFLLDALVAALLTLTA
jgi:AcrR family transcriptional regulator